MCFGCDESKRYCVDTVAQSESEHRLFLPVQTKMQPQSFQWGQQHFQMSPF